jgi:hypothetical protein
MHERSVEDNFLPIEIKVRSCRQQGSSRDHSRRVDETPSLSNYAMRHFEPTNNTGSGVDDTLYR